MKDLYEKEFFVAGVKFHKFDSVKDILEEGDELTLIPEPHNKYDKNAIMIKFNNIMLGYIPNRKKLRLADEVTSVLKSGAELKATIIGLSPDFEPWEALKVRIEEIDLDALN